MDVEQRGRIGRGEWHFRCFAGANPAEIAHETHGVQYRRRAFFALAEQHEIRPQRGSQKTHPLDDDFVVVEHAYIGSGAQLFEFIRNAQDAATIELVVPGNVKHRFGKTGCPGNRLRRARDIPCQDYHIGVIPRYRQRAEAQMQVRQNIEFHKFRMGCAHAGMFAGNMIPRSGSRTLCDTLSTRPDR